MIEPQSTPKTINGGTNDIPLKKDPKLINTVVSFKGRSTGVISIRTKAIYADYQTPESPNSINLATKKTITFWGEALEAIELTDAGSGDVTVVITQFA